MALHFVLYLFCLLYLLCVCVSVCLCNSFVHLSTSHECDNTCVCARARWNQLDLAIVLLSVMGIILEEIEISAALPINPTIIRIMRVLRIARGTYTCVKYLHTHTHTRPVPAKLILAFQ